MKALISKKEEVAKNTMYVEYKLVDETVNFVAGQYFHVLLKEGVKHHFTFVNSPNHNDIVSMCTRLRDSEFKNTLKSLPIGSEVEIYKIKGEFVLPPDPVPVVFIALGIGITPYISMLRYMKEEKLPYEVTLIYSDHEEVDMPFLQELESNTDITFIKKITSTSGHINADFIKEKIKDYKNKTFYVSGPPETVEIVKSELDGLGIMQLITENFTGY